MDKAGCKKYVASNNSEKKQEILAKLEEDFGSGSTGNQAEDVQEEGNQGEIPVEEDDQEGDSIDSQVVGQGSNEEGNQEEHSHYKADVLWA